MKLQIQNIKNIKSATVEMPLEKGIYAFVGENSCGKSTVMLAASLSMMTSTAKMLKSTDYGETSCIRISLDGKTDIWQKCGESFERSDGNFHATAKRNVRCNGFYEGSIFYGSRFDDYPFIDGIMSDPEFESYLVDASEYVTESLGYVLHNNYAFYKNIKKVKNTQIGKKYNFKRLPYFLKLGENKYISQYRMSSGESMLFSLFDFINNLVIRNQGSGKILFLIDEIELALHPSAIDRLMELLNDLMQKCKKELVIYFTTHSAELVQRISPKNLYLMENTDGVVTFVNPCYPNYAIRSLYAANGFDFLVLVEDELAKAIVDKVIRENNLNQSKLCCVLPAGGWSQMAKLHRDLVTYNTLGIGKKIVSVYDGDVLHRKGERDKLMSSEFAAYPKTFLPIPSVEKYLRKKLVTEKDPKFIKLIGDKYFNQKSLIAIVQQYENECHKKKFADNNGKILYDTLLQNLNKIGLPEEKFLFCLCDDIFDYEDISKFVDELAHLLS